MAVLMGHGEAIKALLEHGLDMDDASSDGETALYLAVFHDRLHGDLVDLLLSAGANIDARTMGGLTTFNYAALHPDMRCDNVVPMLQQRQADMESMITCCRSPLNYAAQFGNLTVTRALLAPGADVTLRLRNFKRAPLNVAASYNQVGVIKELARHSVDLDTALKHAGCTALHEAAWENHVGAVDT